MNLLIPGFILVSVGSLLSIISSGKYKLLTVSLYAAGIVLVICGMLSSAGVI